MDNHAQNLLVHFRRAEEIKAASLAFKSLALSLRQLCDLEMLLSRAFYPLTGYMGRDDFESVLSAMRLADGTLWPMPVSLDVPAGLAEKLAVGEKLALRDPEGFMLAVLTIREIWESDPAREARALFDAADIEAHPGALAHARQTNGWRIAGPIEGLTMPPHVDYPEMRLSPCKTQGVFQQRGWRRSRAPP